MAKKTDLERWLQAAQELGVVENPLRTPYDIALKEAAIAADFIQKYWEPTAAHPGLSRVHNRLPKTTAEEILSLVRAVQEAQTNLLLIVDPAVSKYGDRARFLIDTLESLLEFVLDDDVDEPEDQQLAQIQAFHSQNGQRSSALSQALRNLAALARSLQDRIVETDEDFDVKLIAEAEELSKTLAETGGANPPPQSPEARAATLVRNQLLKLLTDRVGKVRRAAGYVFAQHPAIVRQVTSAYQRRQRAALRRAKAEAPPKAPEPS